jgi:hypothetical protein
MHIRLTAAVLGLTALTATAATGSSQATESNRFPTGTYLTKITAIDLYRAGLDLNDAHWESITFTNVGTWKDVWFHPQSKEQPPEHGRYTIDGDRLRILGTPDTVRWHYAAGKLTFSIIHVPDRLARLIYTAHPWRRTK